MKKYISVLITIIIFVVTRSVSGNSNGRLGEKLDNLLRWEEKFGFSGSVLVVKDDEIVINSGYGYSNEKSVFLNTPRTLFYIASVSKPITALGVMKLAGQKRISITDPVTKYFKNVPEDKAGITVEMLLTHTSGLKHTYSCDDITDRSEAVNTILNETPLVSAPGEKFNYSGDNYTLLAAIIEIASGEKFENFITDNILKPAGIDHPSFTGSIAQVNFEEIASPSGNTKYRSLYNIPATWGRKGRAGIILSVEDLYKLDNALSGNEILGSKEVADILSPKIKISTGSDYGYGFSLGTTDQGTKVFGHDGDDDAIGHNVVYLDFPEDKVKIFIASNSRDNGMYYGTSWSEVISSLLQRFLFKPGYRYSNDRLYYNEFAGYSSQSVEKFEGIYKDGNTDYHVWINNKEQLVLSPVGEDAASAFDFSGEYSQKNSLTKNILRQTEAGDYSLLNAFSKDEAAFERLKASMSSLWKSLTEKNGPVEKIEIAGTANIWSGIYGSETATWFKLYFKGNTKLYRMEWDGNGKITGLGGSRIPYPLMFTLNRIAESEFIGFDAANGKKITVNFLNGSEKIKESKMLAVNYGKKKPLLMDNSGYSELLPKRSAAELLYNTILKSGIHAAMNTANEIKSKLSRFDADEDEINSAGYRLLNDNKLNESITIFTILVETFPGSSNGFDSLGEAYMKAGFKSEAVKNYKKSLELDPENENAKKMIERILQK